MTPPKRRQVPAWPRGDQRPDRDPDRRRPAPSHPGFEPREIDVDMDVCRWCATHVPADEIHRVKHEDWDQRIANRLLQLTERVALLEATVAHLSGAGLRTAPSVADGPADASPVPATSPPTPEQEEASGLARPGVGGSNHQHNRPGASGPRGSPDAILPPESSPPGGSGGAKPAREVRNPGKVAASRATSTDEAEQRAYERRLAAESRPR